MSLPKGGKNPQDFNFYGSSSVRVMAGIPPTLIAIRVNAKVLKGNRKVAKK